MHPKRWRYDLPAVEYRRKLAGIVYGIIFGAVAAAGIVVGIPLGLWFAARMGW